MEPISNKPLDSSLVNLGPTSPGPGDQDGAGGGRFAAPATQTSSFPDQIESDARPAPRFGGLIPQEPPATQLSTAPPDSPPPELAAKLDTQLAMARLQENVRPHGRDGARRRATSPEPASPTVQQASAAVAAASTAAGDAEDVLNRMYERAQTILDSGFTRAEDILRFSEDAARQIETRGETESGQILDTARQLADQIRQRAYEEYQPPSIRPPLAEGGDQPPSIGLPDARRRGHDRGETSDWSDMLRDLFNKAMAEADDVWSRGQLDSSSVLEGARALADQTRADGQQQATDVREAAIGASNRIHEFGRSISVNLRQEGIKHADMSKFREDLQRQDIRDDEFRNTLQKELRKLEELLARARESCADPAIRDPKSTTKYTKYTKGFNPQFAICNPQSAIRNRIWNSGTQEWVSLRTPHSALRTPHSPSRTPHSPPFDSLRQK